MLKVRDAALILGEARSTVDFSAFIRSENLFPALLLFRLGLQMTLTPA
jgi:hypothetical protein